MFVKTKYNFNDEVYPIEPIYNTEWVSCKKCNSIDEIKLIDDEEVCTYCKGEGGIEKYVIIRWKIKEDGFGKIKCIYPTLCNDDNKNNVSIIYYLISTGLNKWDEKKWNEKDLFLTKEEAQYECNKRNKILKQEKIQEK